MSAAIFVMIVAWGGILQSKKWAAGLESLRLLLRVCLEAGFDSEKCQFFDETRRLFEEHTLRYGRKKQRWIIKKVAYAAQSLASKHTLSEDALYFHAQFRKTKTRTGQPVTILETTGRGHYVGTLLSMQPERGKHLGYRSAELTPKPRRR